MEKELGAHINSIERDTPKVKLSYQYKDAYGRVFGTFESEDLDLLSDPDSIETTYFDGSIETPYGDFVLECEIPEAKKILAAIADLIKTKEELADVATQLTQARNLLDAMQARYRDRGDEPDYEAYRLVQDLERKKLQLDVKVKAYEDRLKKHRT